MRRFQGVMTQACLETRQGGATKKSAIFELPEGRANLTELLRHSSLTYHQDTHHSSFLEFRPNSLRSIDASLNPALLTTFIPLEIISRRLRRGLPLGNNPHGDLNTPRGFLTGFIRIFVLVLSF